MIAEGTSGELKARVGGERLEVTVARGDGLEAAAGVLERYAHGESGMHVDAERGYLGTTVAGGPGLLAAVVRDRDAAGCRLMSWVCTVPPSTTCSSPSRAARRSPTPREASSHAGTAGRLWAWCVGILAVFVPLSVSLYRRVAAR